MTNWLSILLPSIILIQFRISKREFQLSFEGSFSLWVLRISSRTLELRVLWASSMRFVMYIRPSFYFLQRRHGILGTFMLYSTR
jgi:hypothetical protein